MEIVKGKVTISLDDYERLKSSDNQILKHHEEVLQKLEDVTGNLVVCRLLKGFGSYVYYIDGTANDFFKKMTVRQFKKWQKENK